MRTETCCPSPEELAAFLLGKLPEQREELLNRHLETCTACEARAQQLEQEPDQLIHALRQPDAPAGRLAASTPAVTLPAAPAGPQQQPVAELFRLEGYRILGEVGRGGMGVVYQAVQLRLDRVVVVKMILAGFLAGQEERLRFLLEGELLARLNHPNFVQVHEVGTVDLSAGTAQPYLVLEHVEGGNLRDKLARGSLPFREAAELVRILAEAMEAAHAQGIIHRDLKPANVLIAGDGTLKITDFGLAKEIGPNASLTPTGVTIGTPNYMAPEQAGESRAAISPATDVYALGAILYEMLAGKPPFDGDTPVNIIMQVLLKTPVPASRVRSGVPRDLEVICLKCLEKDARHRYARAADLANDLQCWLDGRPIRARPAGAVERVYKWVKRHPLPAALLAFLVVSLVAGSAASTYFGLAAIRRADEAQQAMGKEGQARQQADKARLASEHDAQEARDAQFVSDRQAALLELASGQALAEAGQIDRGLFVMLSAWDKVPGNASDLRRLIRLNLEAWAPYLPRLRWSADCASGSVLMFLGEEQFLRSAGQQLFVHDTATGRQQGPARELPGDQIAACSPDGRLVLTVTTRPDAKLLRVFERQTGKQVGSDVLDSRGQELVPEPGLPYYTVRFSPDQTLLLREVLSGATQERQLWQVRTGKEAGPPFRLTGPITAYLLQAKKGPTETGPSHPYWIVIPPSGSLEVRDGLTGKPLPEAPAWRVPDEVERPPTLFPEPNTLQGWVSPNGLHLGLWDLTSGKALLPPWRVTRISNSPFLRLTSDGRYLASISTDQRLRWYDVASQQPCVPTAGLAGTKGIDDRIELSPDGRRCLCAPSPGNLLKLFEFPRLLPASTPGGPPGQSRLPVATRAPALFASAVFSPDREAVLLGGEKGPRAQQLAYARLTSTRDNHPLGLPLTDCDYLGVYSPSGRLVALASSHNEEAAPDSLVVRVYDSRTGEPRTPRVPMPRFVHALRFSPDERLLAVGHVAGVLLCEVGPEPRPRALVQPGPINRMLFSPDGSRLAAGTREGWGAPPGLRVWDVKTCQPVADLVPMADAPLLIPDPKGSEFTAIEVDSGRVRRWDFETGRPQADRGRLAAWPGWHRDSGALAISSDGQRLALGSSGGRISQWDLETCRRLGQDADFGQPIPILEYSPDGNWLAVAGEEGTVGLFDSGTGSRVGPTLAHRITLRGLAFTPDGRELLTAGVDGRCVRWPLGRPLPLGPGRWLELLEATTGLRLDDDRLVVPLAAAEYRQQLESTRELQALLAGPAPSLPAWHAEQAQDALQAGQLTSARWHLDRWITLEPDNWLPLAWRATVHSLEGLPKEADADLEQASRLGGGEELANWKRHQGVVARLLGRPAPFPDAKPAP